MIFVQVNEKKKSGVTCRSIVFVCLLVCLFVCLSVAIVVLVV